MPGRFRRFLVAFCAVVSLTALLLGATYTYLSRTFFNADVFATRVADGLSAPELSSVVAGILSDQIIAARQDLLPYRPIIVASVERVVGSAPFRAVIRRAVRETHETIISGQGQSIALTVQDAGVVVRDALAMHPEIAAKIPARALAVIGDQNDWPSGKYLARVLQIANRARVRAWFLLGLSLLTGAVAVGLSRRRDRYLVRYGLAMAVAGLVLGLAAQFGGAILASFAKTEFMSRLGRGLWVAFIGPLALRMWIFGGIGLVVVAGVTSTFNRVDLAAMASRSWRGLGSRPRRGSLGLLRGAGLALAGGVAVFQPTLAIQVLIVAGAGVLFFFGIQEIFVALMSWIPRVEAAAATASGDGRSLAPRIAVAVVLGLALAGAGAFWYARQDQEPVVASVVDVCNGHPELCDRRFDRVALATTHNSMSAGDIADWMFPNQQKGIRKQLEDGIRGFLIDVHYGVPVGDHVKTILDDEVAARAKYEEALGKEAVDAAMRMRDRMVGKETGDRDVYLGHGFCELGATRFVDALETIDEFLIANPGEVIAIVIQDEGVTPQDVADCFERSGLIRLVYRGAVTSPWPTLREMVESDQRVVVLAENNAEGVAWYHPAFEVCQETPYGFKDPSEFSNRPNRGGTSGSLLLMNHWIETTPTPLPSNAEIVNAYDFLLKRARACRKERGMIPNLVAVDFYRSGDVVRVVDTLNGFGPAAAAAR
ncbi:MAG TPA: hypothetical protein VFX92_14630 [Candidatus Krumholzibacteria bacterium]|nr:hypothetical protein [Candidatus Krumholzibacteria bacterium]